MADPGPGRAAQQRLLGRLRELLDAEGPLREVPMFGSRALMLEDSMLVCALPGGRLLARVDPARHEELLTRPGALQAEMGAGRSMGPGWIEVAAEHLETAEELTDWTETALERHRKHP